MVDWWIVRIGEHHPIVPTLKRRLGFPVCDDLYDTTLELRIRGLQLIHGLRQHGQLDRDTLDKIGFDYAPDSN